MNRNPEFEEAIASFSPEMQQLAISTRKLIHEILPEVVEVVWIKQKNTGFGTGKKKKTEHFCWLMPASRHVTLGFNYGAELPDPKHLLTGTGKLFRHIKINSLEQLSNPDLIVMLKYASSFKVPPIKSNF